MAASLTLGGRTVSLFIRACRRPRERFLSYAIPDGARSAMSRRTSRQPTRPNFAVGVPRVNLGPGLEPIRPVSHPKRLGAKGEQSRDMRLVLESAARMLPLAEKALPILTPQFSRPARQSSGLAPSTAEHHRSA